MTDHWLTQFRFIPNTTLTLPSFQFESNESVCGLEAALLAPTPPQEIRSAVAAETVASNSTRGPSSIFSLLQTPSGPIDLGLGVDGPSPQRPITVAPCWGADQFLHIYSASAGKRVSNLGWAANAEPVVQPSGLVEMYPLACYLPMMSVPPSPCWRWVRDDFSMSFRIFYGFVWKLSVFIVLMIDFCLTG